MKLTTAACCVFALGFTSVESNSYAGDSPQLLQPMTTNDQVSTLKPGSKVVMTCAKCRTVQIAEVDKKHGILGWFQPKTKHLCPGCGGYWGYVVYGKGSRHGDYRHICSKCGDKSMFCCSTQPGQKKGM